MATKKDLIIIVLTTFCLTVALFTVMPSRSQSELRYDPWMDINDDGSIDMADISFLIEEFMATGIPINKTELLYEVNATFTQLLGKIASLNSSLVNLHSKIQTLNRS